MGVMTRREAADYLRVSQRTLDRFRAAGLLPSFKVRGVVRLRREDVEAFLARFLKSESMQRDERPTAPRVTVQGGHERLLGDDREGPAHA